MHRFLTSSLLALSLIGCNTVRDGDPPTAFDEASLSRFASCSSLKDYVAEAWLETVIRMRYGNYGYTVLEDAMSGTAPAAADDGRSSSPTDFSETNNQEAGVDEPDIVKTDGNFVYVVQQGRAELTIVKSWPAEDAAVVGRLDIAGSPHAMFLSGDRAVVFSYMWNEYEGRGTASKYRDGYATRITLVDVSDRSNPSIERQIDIEGYMSSGRLIEDDLYLVLDSRSYVPQEIWEIAWDESLALPEFDWEASDAEQEAVRAQARRILRPVIEEQVDRTDVANLLPRTFDKVAGEPEVTSSLLGCRDVYHPDSISDPAVLSVTHLDLSDSGTELSATALLSSGWTVYASQDNLYVAQSSFNWWWGWGDVDMRTHIHKFALDGADTVYRRSSSVGGWLWTQFAMSEHEGFLRVATTDLDWWWGVGTDDDDAPGNNLYVLDDRMKTVGSVEGFAPGEQIYAARFLGDEGYVVTFRQIDPLFTFDLSNPREPRIAGELKIPGFSSYLHPYGDGRLIGVGMDGDDDGNIFGLAVNLFDVDDLSSPQLIDQVLIESDDWSFSEALWNHHAFTLHRDVLNLPVYTWNWHEYDGSWDSFSGMMSVDVSENDLSMLGRVSHGDLVEDSECLYSWYGYGDENVCSDYYWYASMRRSVVIEDNLFSISDYGIKVTDLNAPDTELARVMFWPKAP